MIGRPRGGVILLLVRGHPQGTRLHSGLPAASKVQRPPVIAMKGYGVSSGSAVDSGK
jgi:hypothetical protein